MMLAPISLFVAFLALMAKWLLTLSSYVVAPLMLYIFGCGIYTVYRQTWDQFLILLVAEFLCFVLFVGATAMVEGVEKFSGWLRDRILRKRRKKYEKKSKLDKTGLHCYFSGFCSFCRDVGKKHF